MNELALKVGNNIRYYRKLKGMSQMDLSFAIGCNSIGSGVISHYETGRQNMGIEKLTRICKALDVTLEEFFRNIRL